MGVTQRKKDAKRDRELTREIHERWERVQAGTESQVQTTRRATDWSLGVHSTPDRNPANNLTPLLWKAIIFQFRSTLV